MLKLIMLDMDGLMLDTERVYYQAFSEVCVRHGLPVCRDIYLKTVGRDDDMERKIYKESFAPLDGTLLHGEIQALCEEKLRSGTVDVKPGLFQLLDAVDRYGHIRKAVVTSNQREVAVDLLKKTGIFYRLDGGVYREMVTHGKPAPDSYRLCCELFSTLPGESLALEDSEPGIRAAQAAGTTVIAIPDLVEPSEEVLSGCLARCSDLEKVIPYLERL